MKNRIFLFIFCAISIVSAFASTVEIDSLQQLLENTDTNNERRPLLMNRLSEAYLQISPDIAESYAMNALNESRKLDDKKEEIVALNNLAQAYFYQGIYNLSQQYLNDAEKLARNSNLHEEYIKTLLNKGQFYLNKSDYASSMKVMEQCLSLSEKYDYQEGIMQAKNNMGRIYYNKGLNSEAIKSYNEAIEIAQSTENWYELASLYNNIGLVYDHLAEYEKVINYYEKAKKIGERLGDDYLYSTVLINIGIVYSNWGDYDKALEYYMQSLKIAKNLSDQRILASLYVNLGIAYNKIGQNKQAIDYYTKSLAMFKKIGNKKGYANTLNWIGILHLEGKDYEKAKNYLESALIENMEVDNTIGVISSLLNLGTVYLEEGKPQKSMEYLTESFQLSKKIKHKEFIRDNYFLFSGLHQSMGDYETALKYYKKYKAIEDSIFSENKHKTVAELEIRFETQKKQQELELLQQTNRNQELEIRKNHYLVIGLIVVLLSIIIISLLILRQNKMKDAQKNLMLEQKLLRLQMNPHFIFNTLTAIQNFIYKSQQKEAANFLSRFAKLVRLILENSREEYISLEKELTTLEYYLQLQELRFKGKTSYDLYVDDKLEVDFLAIPPMLAQPFIENAIEHGILPKKDKGHISVRFLKKEEFILFEVEDNGIGRVESAKIKKEESHKSLATALTNERLVILNKRLRNKIMLNIEDLYEGSEASGTKVSFSIPYRTPDN